MGGCVPGPARSYTQGLIVLSPQEIWYLNAQEEKPILASALAWWQCPLGPGLF